jgi:hypothetical protein
LIAGLGSGLCWFASRDGAWAATGAADDTTRRLRTLLAPSPLQRRMGRSYRERFPLENDPQSISARLLSTLERTPAELLAATHVELLQRLEQAVRNEFAAAATLQLEGWVVSRTEGRLCALCE